MTANGPRDARLAAQTVTPGAVDQVVREALQATREELVRVDSKAGMLLALATGGLAGVAAIASAWADTLAPPAAVMMWTATALLGLAVAFLLAAVRPRLPRPGKLGTFATYAAAETPAAVLDHARAVAEAATQFHASDLRALSQLAMTKYKKVRSACQLLLTGLATLAAVPVLVTVGSL